MMVSLALKNYFFSERIEFRLKMLEHLEAKLLLEKEMLEKLLEIQKRA